MPGRSYNIAMTGNQYKFSGTPINAHILFTYRGEIVHDFKELDEEGGLDWYYFGARYYWSAAMPKAGKRKSRPLGMIRRLGGGEAWIL